MDSILQAKYCLGDHCDTVVGVLPRAVCEGKYYMQKMHTLNILPLIQALDPCLPRAPSLTADSKPGGSERCRFVRAKRFPLGAFLCGPQSSLYGKCCSLICFVELIPWDLRSL